MTVPVGYHGKRFLKITAILHLCKGIRSGLHGNRARANETRQFICKNKTKTHSSQVGRVGRGRERFKGQLQRGSK